MRIGNHNLDSSKKVDLEDDIVAEKKIKSIKKRTFLVIIIAMLSGIFLCGYIGKKYIIEPLDELFKSSEEFIAESSSSDGKYDIQAYLVNGGATTDWAVVCYLNIGGSKKKETIYNDYHINKAEISWADKDTVIINGHEIDLPDGKYDWTEK
ncbi:DUF5412 family protein [Clostridium vincentii]|uniref:DUF5412 family protein n=1 Tax=Clostridium vincentii TaxID=52704 RepID=UPI000D04106D|nr:DUF5412 family protein [Clostridium vincentii]